MEKLFVRIDWNHMEIKALRFSWKSIVKLAGNKCLISLYKEIGGNVAGRLKDEFSSNRARNDGSLNFYSLQFKHRMKYLICEWLINLDTKNTLFIFIKQFFLSFKICAWIAFCNSKMEFPIILGNSQSDRLIFFSDHSIFL